MSLKRSPFLLAMASILAAGCVKQAGPEPSIEKFSIDAAPEALNPSCSTGGLEGCETTQSLKAGVAAMQDLHDKQMSEMTTALSALSGVLNRKDSTPTARITAEKLSTDSWTDPEGSYPANLEVRIQNIRGLERMGENSVNDMKGALAALDKLATDHKEQWGTTLQSQPKGLVLPESLSEERATTQVTAALDDADYSFQVPSHLAGDHIQRDVAPWVVVASHVISEEGMKYEVVQEHRKQLTGAITVSGSGPFTISELKPNRELHTFGSEVTPSDACQKLRGELRFTRADTPVPLRATFRDLSSNGGAK